MRLALLLLAWCVPCASAGAQEVELPVRVPDRHSTQGLALTEIGQYGLVRKSRPTVPSHYHTGIDIRRPARNYVDEPIYPIAKGTVISKREDGPYGQLIVEHKIGGVRCWSVYEHVAGISVDLQSSVDPSRPIARFFNSRELQKYGWQFDHVHLEILRRQPIPLQPTVLTPERLFSSYSLVCHSRDDLARYFYNPLEFFHEHGATAEGEEMKK